MDFVSLLALTAGFVVGASGQNQATRSGEEREKDLAEKAWVLWDVQTEYIHAQDVIPWRAGLPPGWTWRPSMVEPNPLLLRTYVVRSHGGGQRSADVVDIVMNRCVPSVSLDIAFRLENQRSFLLRQPSLHDVLFHWSIEMLRRSARRRNHHVEEVETFIATLAQNDLQRTQDFILSLYPRIGEINPEFLLMRRLNRHWSIANALESTVQLREQSVQLAQDEDYLAWQKAHERYIEEDAALLQEMLLEAELEHYLH